MMRTSVLCRLLKLEMNRSGRVFAYALARDAFHRIDTADRVRRSILAGPRPTKKFNPGELVHAHWHGPCTVIGHQKSKIWVNFRGHLWLCCPEQVRPATLEESTAQQHVGDELQRLAEELEAPGSRYFALPEDSAEGLEEPSTSARLRRQPDQGSVRGRSPGPSRASAQTPRYTAIYSHVITEVMDGQATEDPDLLDMDLTCSSVSPFSCVYINMADEVKKRKEITFLHLKKSDQDRFKVARDSEWQNILQPHNDHSSRLLDLQESISVREDPSLKERIVQTRWVLVEKDMGQYELVLQGFRDPDLQDLDVASPTLSKDSLPVVLQSIASCRWKLQIAGIQGACMKSRPLNRKQGAVYAAMPSLGTLPLDADRVQLIEIRCAWYGLNDGPKEFYESFHAEVTKLRCRGS
eukprot:6491285-Amphidinium_carterae.5